MKYQEKKYRVDSFAKIRNKLESAGAKKLQNMVNTHYYTPQSSNDVVKLVSSEDSNEIHILKESGGQFSLQDKISLDDIKSGFKWLKSKGYASVEIVKMEYSEFEYKGGIVGLYIINDSLNSVILDFPAGQHRKIEKKLGLDNAEAIKVPYNKYLKQMGQLKLINL